VVIKGNQWSSEAIRGHQWSSEVIRGHLAAHPDPDRCIRCSSVHMPRALIVASHEHLVVPDEGGHQRSSEVIRAHQRSSEVISGHQWSSEVI
jgi:hypothetical protein